MNTKFFFVLLAALIVLIVAACAPAITDSDAPIDPVQPADNEILAPVPVTGNSAAEAQRLEAEPRLQSGEILSSDTDNPDAQLNVQTDAQQDLQTGCMSEDSQPKRQGGCME